MCGIGTIELVDGDDGDEEEDSGTEPVCEEEPNHLTKGIQISRLSKASTDHTCNYAQTGLCVSYTTK